MRFSKSLFVAFAGLGLFACSNEDVTNESGAEGNASVSVEIKLPKVITEGRSGNGIVAGNATTGTTGTTTPLQVNNITVTLHAASGKQEDQTLKESGTVTFQNVRNPQSIEVSVNGGTTEKLTIAGINTAGLAAPLYGTSNSFTKKGESTYQVSVTPAARYARLELSNISHAKAESEQGCIFQTATIAGMFLDNLWVTEGSNAGKIAVSADKSIWDNIKTETYASPTWSAIGADFLGQNATWPTGDNQCFAYSVFEPGTDMPKLVFVLDGTNLALKQGVSIMGWNAGEELYASVGKYKYSGNLQDLTEEDKAKYGIDNLGYITSFKAGNIYKISGIAIPDGAWGPTPEGGTDVTVEATVTVLPWTVVEGTVEWN